MRRATSILLSSLFLALFASGCADLDPCKRGTEGCACRLPERTTSTTLACDDAMICAKGTCVAQPGYDAATVCYDACAYRSDGTCDDGEAGSVHSDCNYGSDCGDCGPRANPCAGMAKPVYCPQTPGECWPTGTDCLAARYCPGEPTPFACASGQAVDCSLGGTNRCVTASSCQSRGLAPCVDEGACVAPHIDCTTLTTCGTNTVGCYRGEVIECVSGQPTCQVQ